MVANIRGHGKMQSAVELSAMVRDASVDSSMAFFGRSVDITLGKSIMHE